MPAEEIFALADDFARAADDIVTELHDVFDTSAEQAVEGWQDNVREASPRGHLKKLPVAITHETRYTLGGIRTEFGPEYGRSQAGLGRIDEFGSPTSPPHLSGLRAMEAEEPQLEAAARRAIDRVIP